jgi:hypothetical protein
MAEHNGEDKYIKCSKCKCKYINDDKHIKNDFGFNRLNERFKTCTKCRTKTSETVNLKTLPDELTNKIIMMAIPAYPFMDELKTTRFVRNCCDCEGCTEKQHYGCYYYDDFNYRLKPTNSILTLSGI